MMARGTLLSIAVLHLCCPIQSAASPRRLLVNGTMVSEPEHPGMPVRLRGFTFMFEANKDGMSEVSDLDKQVSTLLPGTNFARLVMDHWRDGPTWGKHGQDCYSSDASQGYITPVCLALFDSAVQWASSKGMWTVITARASLAAGDGDKHASNNTVFDNQTLHDEMITMWGFLSQRYKNTDSIAGFEVMSEPRTDKSAAVVHEFHKAACAAVWNEDPEAVCFIGASTFYDRYSLNSDYILPGKVVYAANFFEPKNWVNGANKNLAYGGTYRCCDVTQKDACGGNKNCGQQVVLDKNYLTTQLKPLLDFRKLANAPVWIDQWGVEESAGGDKSGQDKYLDDVMGLFEEYDLHWTYWIWRRTFNDCPGGFAVFCKLSNGSYYQNQFLLQKLGTLIGSDKQSTNSVLV